MSIKCDFSLEPSWSIIIPEWYKLDALSFSLCSFVEAAHDLRAKAAPNIVFMCLSDASIEADRDYVQFGRTKIQKFIYTLPNIPFLSFAKMLNLTCEMYCLNKGPKTIDEAKKIISALSKNTKVWVIFAELIAPREYRITFSEYLSCIKTLP